MNSVRSVDVKCGTVVVIMEMKCETSLENREGTGIDGEHTLKNQRTLIGLFVCPAPRTIKNGFISSNSVDSIIPLAISNYRL